MSCTLPYFIFLITAAFVALSTCIGLYFPEYCASEECNEGGVQNTAMILPSIDFFVAVSSAILAFHLMYTTMKGGMAGSAFLMVASGYIFKGFVASFFGNSGFDDGKGMLTHCILITLCHICWTLAGGIFFKYFLEARRLLERDEEPCGCWQGLILFLLTTLSTLAMILATVASSIDSLAIVSFIDMYPDEGNRTTLWMLVFAIAKTCFSVCYSSLLIFGAFVFGALTRKDDVLVWGLSSSFAARGIELSQAVAIGFTLPHGLQLMDDEEYWQFEEESDMIAHILLGYMMLMTYFFLHNLVFALLPPRVSTKNLTETPEGSDSQTVHDSIVKQILSSQENGSDKSLMMVGAGGNRQDYDGIGHRNSVGPLIGERKSSCSSNSSSSTSYDNDEEMIYFYNGGSEPDENLFNDLCWSWNTLGDDAIFGVRDNISENMNASDKRNCCSEEKGRAEDPRDTTIVAQTAHENVNHTGSNFGKKIEADPRMTEEGDYRDKPPIDSDHNNIVAHLTMVTEACESFGEIANGFVKSNFSIHGEIPVGSAAGICHYSPGSDLGNSVTESSKLGSKDNPSSNGANPNCDVNHDATFVTKAEDRVMDECRQDVEVPIDSFNAKDSIEDDVTANNDRSSGSSPKQAPFLSSASRRPSFFKPKKEEPEKLVDKSNVLCDVGIRIDNKEASGVPLRLDRAVYQNLKSNYTLQANPRDGLLSCNSANKGAASEIIQNETGFEIVFDESIWV
ncbi:hypothetical protein IV203_035290 [Nitzschia inconspicua]|uniref:Uncharacterized protein n=1 Tax=Nitzschia inconspicua TaxID=303405 RepID=A0A9K3PUT8_9STRA|nr:hypothetical protein IV203_035290 [Nitzschia inconspicua]